MEMGSVNVVEGDGEEGGDKGKMGDGEKEITK